MRKKHFIIIIAICLILISGTFAYGNTADEKGINEFKSDIENLIDAAYATELLVSESTRTNLYLGEKINVYNVTESGNVQLDDTTYWPVLTSTGEIKGIVISFLDENLQVLYEFNTNYNDILNNAAHNRKHISFLRDKYAFWMYDNGFIEQLLVFDEPVQELGNLQNNSINFSKIHTSSINNSMALIYEGQTRDPSVSNSLSVPIITQSSGSSYCWACSAVSAGKYKNPSVSISAVDIAIEYAGDIYTPMSMSTTKIVIAEKYGRSFYTYSQNLNYSIVQTSIDNGRPMVTKVQYNSGGGHQFVVKGYDIPASGSSYLSIMDPLSGSRLLSQTSGTSLQYWNPNKTTTYQILNSFAVN